MGNSQFEPPHGRGATTGVFRRGYVEKEGLNLAPQVGFEPTTLRLTAEWLIAASPCKHKARNAPKTRQITVSSYKPTTVLPLGGAVAPVAPTGANTGQFWRANCRQPGWVLFGGILLERCASWRVVAQIP